MNRPHGVMESSGELDAEDDSGMAGFFSQMTIKRTKEWKEEIVVVDLRTKMQATPSSSMATRLK